MNIFDPLISGSLSVSGSGEISGDLTVLGTINATISGTTSNAISASHAAEYTLTSSFEQFTGSYTTGSFTGSFIGDGSELYNIPASGVTGLQLDKISSGNASASIDDTGLRVNRNLYVDGTITAEEIYTTFVTTSVLYQSGSTKFGDSLDDLHEITGSVNITGSLSVGTIDIAGNSIVENNVSDSGGKYFIDGVSNPTITFVKGFTYKLLYPNIASHPFRFSTTNDGTHNGGTIYSTDVTIGDDYIQIKITDSTPTTLYYFCTSHAGMGNSINVLSDILNVEADRALVYIEPSRIATTGSNTFIGNQTISGSILPQGTLTHDLGSDTQRWRDIYLAGNTINIGGTKISKNDDGNLELKDSSNNLKTFIGEEFQIGTGSNSIIIKRDPSGYFRLAGETQPFIAAQLSGSFTGSGQGLYDIPASGVTGLNLTQISDGSSTASISDTDGLRVNTNTEITGSLTVEGNQQVMGGLSTTDYISTDDVLYTNHIEEQATNGGIDFVAGGFGFKFNNNVEVTGSLISTEGFTGSLHGNSDTSTLASSASIAPDYSGLSNRYVLFGSTTSGNSALMGDISLIFKPSSNTLVSTNFEGTASVAAQQILSNFNTTGESSLVLTTGGTGAKALGVDSDAKLTYSSQDNRLTVPFISGSILATNDVISGSIQVEITGTTGYSTFSSSIDDSITNSINGISTSFASHDLIQDGRLNNIETSTGSLNSFTSSINTTIKNKLNTEGVISGSIQVDITGTSGYSTFSSSIATTDSGQNNRLNSLEGKTGSYATTGSNSFLGNQTITGSLVVTQDLQVLGSSSIVYSTASQLIVEDNVIVVNASYPAERFAGIEVHDSGSNGSITASLFWDGLNNRWIYQNTSDAHYGGGMFIAGPRNTGSLGDEPGLTSGKLPKSIGGDHIGDSIINETDGVIYVTGSLSATGTVYGTNINAIETSTASLNQFTSSLESAIELTGSNFTIKGDLLVKGTTTNVNTTTLDVDNNLINLNGTGATSAGLRVRDTTAPNQVSGSLLWDATNDYWIAGQLGSEQRLVRETEFNNAVTRIGNVETSTGSLNSFTSSINTTIKNKLNNDGVISGSSQVSFNGITDKPTLVSGSSQISFSGISSKPALVSGSSQISFNGITDKPTLVSGSSQISFNSISDKPTLVSGSSQISYTGLSDIPSGIISGSAQLTSTFVQKAGDTMTGQLIIGSTGVGNAATLKVNNSSASSFNHSIEAFSANMTAGQTNILVVGKAGTTKNSGYIGYNWAGAGSNSNYVSLGHWGADHLLRIYGDGTVYMGTVTTGVWNGTAIGDSYISSASNWNTAYNKRISSLGFTSSTVTITLADTTTVTASVPTFNQNTTGNAGTVTNGVYTTGDQTITGQKTFPSTIGNRPILAGGFISAATGDLNVDLWGISEDYYPSHATAGNAWGIRWSGDTNDIQFVGGGSNRFVFDLDNGNLTAGGTITASGGNSGNWNTAYGWGNHASAGYLTSVTNISGYANNLYSQDIRTIAPNSHGAYRLNFGFTAFNNNNSSPWADYIHLRSYSDSSGGADNLLVFRKTDGIEMRIYQQSWGSSTAYSEYRRVAMTTSTTFTSVTSLTFNHGLLTDRLTAQVFDTNGDMFFPSNIRITSTQVIVTFSSSRSGRLVVTG